MLCPRGHHTCLPTDKQQLMPLDRQPGKYWPCENSHHQTLPDRPTLLLLRPRHGRPVSLRGPTTIAHTSGHQDLPRSTRNRTPRTTTHYTRPPPPPSVKARALHPQGGHPQGGLLHSLRSLSTHRGIHLVNRGLESRGRIPPVAYDQKLGTIPPDPR